MDSQRHVVNMLKEDKNIQLKKILSSHSERIPKIVFQERLLLNACQKYCRMLQGEHYAILSTYIKLPFPLRPLFRYLDLPERPRKYRKDQRITGKH